MLLLLLPKFRTRGANPSLVELANPLLTAHADLGLSGNHANHQSHKI